MEQHQARTVGLNMITDRIVRAVVLAVCAFLPSCALLQGDDVGPIAGGVGGMSTAYDLQADTNRSLIRLCRSKGLPEDSIAEVDRQMRDADEMFEQHRAGVEAGLALIGSRTFADLREIVRDVSRDLKARREEDPEPEPQPDPQP